MLSKPPPVPSAPSSANAASSATVRYTYPSAVGGPGQLTRHLTTKSGHQSKVALSDLEYAYAPVRDQVRDLREYL